MLLAEDLVADLDLAGEERWAGIVAPEYVGTRARNGAKLNSIQPYPTECYS